MYEEGTPNCVCCHQLARMIVGIAPAGAFEKGLCVPLRRTLHTKVPVVSDTPGNPIRGPEPGANLADAATARTSRFSS